MIQTNPKSDYNYSYNRMKNDVSRKNWINKANFSIMIKFILTLIFVILIVVAYIGQSLKLTHLNYKLNDLKQELSTIEDSNYQLKIQLAKKSSLARIEKIARTKLKMTEPEKIEIVVLNNEKPTPQPAKQEKIFLARLFDNLMDSIGTVKAGDLGGEDG